MIGRRLLKISALILILGTIGYRGYSYFVKHDITLEVYTLCDSTKDSCFIAQDEKAVDFDFQTEPYKKIQILDRYAPACLEEHACSSFSCSGIPSCKETLCDDTTIEDNEMCTQEPEI